MSKIIIAEAQRKEIKQIIFRFVDNVINRRVIEEPYDPEFEAKTRPFHYALVPEEIWKSSKFERSFVTSLGQIGWEQIAKVVAEGIGYYAELNKMMTGYITEKQNFVIHKILDELEHSPRKPNWQKEIGEIIEVGKIGKRDIQVSVITDLYIEKKLEKLFIEVKSSKPNSDQTKVSKEKMLKLYALNSSYKVYFALPDNPYGTKDKYNHPYPMRWFDMRNDNVVVMGEEFWNEILGIKGTFQDLINIFLEAGKVTKEKIRKDFLGI